MSQLSECKKELNLLENELEIVMDILSKINMDMDFNHVLDEIIQTIRQKISIDNCNFALIDRDGFIALHKIQSESAFQYKAPKEYLDKLFNKKWDYKEYDRWICTVAREEKELHYPEIHIGHFPVEIQNHIRIMGITGWYGIPIRSEGKVLGIMIFVNYGKPLYLSDFEKNLIRRRVALVAKAIENLRLYQEIRRKKMELEEDLLLAKRIQRNFLPQGRPPINEIALAYEYIPMTEVGGDYFDFIVRQENDSKGFGILVSDVSGHGVPAAFIASMVKMCFQSQFLSIIANSPNKVLREINKNLLNNIAGNFVTAVYAYFDLNRRIIKISSAGHIPFFQINKSSGEIKEFHPKGKVLGIFENPVFEEIELQITPDFRFFFFTDGLVESVNKDGEVFEDKLRLILSKIYSLPVSEFCSQILENLKSHALYQGKTSLDDDMAMIAVDYSDSPAIK